MPQSLKTVAVIFSKASEITGFWELTGPFTWKRGLKVFLQVVHYFKWSIWSAFQMQLKHTDFKYISAVFQTLEFKNEEGFKQNVSWFQTCFKWNPNGFQMQNKQKCPSKAFVIMPLYKTNYIVEQISEENLGVCVNLNSHGRFLFNLCLVLFLLLFQILPNVSGELSIFPIEVQFLFLFRK